MKRAILLSLLLGIIPLLGYSQQSVSIGTEQINTNAVLWLQGNGSQGLILPVVNNRTGVTAVKGMVVFDDSDDKVYYHTGSAWVEVGGSGNSNAQTLTISGNTLSISDGNSVQISNVNPSTAGQILQWDAGNSRWTSSMATFPSVGQVLKWNGTAWTPSQDDIGGAAATLSNGQILIGDGTTNLATMLSGDATLNGGTITIANNAINGAKIADGSVSSAEIEDGTIVAADLNGMGATNGQVLQYNGTVWNPVTLSGGGSVTNVSGTGPISVTNPTTTPVVSISQANGTTAGFLSSTDWAAFNAKLGVAATTGGDLSGTVVSPTVVGIQGRGVANTAPTNGQVLQYNGTIWNPVTLSGGGDITGVIAGTGLTGGAASGDVTLNVDVGTTANKIVQLDATGRLPAVDGSQLTGLAGGGDITGVVAGTGLTGGATSGNATLNVDVGTTANKIVQLDGTGRLPAVDGSQLTGLAGGGDITGVVAGTGLTGGATSGNATLNVDVGTTANKIVQLDGTGRLPAVDGSLLTNLPTGSGTVTSVGLTLPSIFSVTGSPVTTAGTLSATLASQTAGTVFAAPAGSAGAPTFRALAATDIPTLDASKITTGILPIAQGGTGANSPTAALTNLGAMNNTLNAGEIFVGNASNIAIAVAVQGDATMSSLGNLTIANDAINSAKILDGSIVDADVNAAAAIAGTKINPNFGAQNISTTGSGSVNQLIVGNEIRLGASPGTAGQVLTSAGPGVLPTWSSAGVPTLTNGQFFVGNASNVATGVTMSGDATITNAGVMTIANNAINSAKILDGSIVDADVNAAAAILGTKITPSFGNQVIFTSGNTFAGDIYGVNSTVTGAGNVYGNFANVTSTGGAGTSGHGSWSRSNGGTVASIGVYGSGRGSANNNYGVFSVADGPGAVNYGIFGQAFGGTTNWAGYFEGNTAITGALAVGGSNDQGAAGQVLTSSGPGVNPTWTNISGGGTLQSAYDGGNIIVGTNAIDMTLENGIVASGVLGTGGIPASGAGTRMMFYPGKAAFRVGETINDPSGTNNESTNWDDANVGLYSFATGLNTGASGDRAFAAGKRSYANGLSSVAMGDNAVAEGNFSVAFGFASTATGQESFAAGRGTNADSRQSAAFGAYNVGGGSPSAFNAGDPIFEVGNGTSSGAKSNALTILKNGNTSIKGTSPILSLEVNGTDAIRLPVGTDAQRPSTPSAGFFRYNSTAGGLEYHNGGGWLAVATGAGSPLISNTGTRNLFAGTSVATVGTDNAIFGHQAGQNNNTYNYSVVVGTQAGFNKQGGSLNTIVGYRAGYGGTNWDAGANTFIGAEAGFSITSGGVNTFIGERAGRSVTTSTRNIMIGNSAGLASTTGAGRNIFIGNDVAASNLTGSSLTIIGTDANVSSGNLTNATAIGYQAIVGANNSLVLGGTGANAVNVGIGNTNPNALLSLGDLLATPVGDRSVFMSQDGGDTFFETASGDMSEGLVMHGAGGGESGIVRNINSNGFMTGKPVGLHIFNDLAEPIMFTTSNIERMKIDPTGNVGIGTSTPSQKLHVVHANTPSSDGLMIQNGAGAQNITFYVTSATGNLALYENSNFIGQFAATNGAYTEVSDRRVKKNIHTMENVLPRLTTLNIRRYHFIKQNDNDPSNIGVIAQELKELFPELVQYSADNDRYSVDYAGLAPVAIKAIQEQQEIIEAQKKQIEQMELLLKSVQNTNEQLSSQMESLANDIEAIKKSIGLDKQAKKTN